jgi:two-component system, chemotaxis family, chemotaxis protein CheY
MAAYKQYAPDILLLDIHMPGKDGLEVLHDIQDIDPQAYIIMLSADSSAENVGYTLQEGAKGFMTKPFTREKLLELTHKCPTIS